MHFFRYGRTIDVKINSLHFLLGLGSLLLGGLVEGTTGVTAEARGGGLLLALVGSLLVGVGGLTGLGVGLALRLGRLTALVWCRHCGYVDVCGWIIC